MTGKADCIHKMRKEAVKVGGEIFRLGVVSRVEALRLRGSQE